MKPFQDQVLYLEGLPPINVVSGNTFKTGDVNTYIDTYVRSQPAVLLNRCAMINLCDENNMNYFKQTHDMSLDEDAYAFAHSADMNIFVPLNLTDYDQETVTHELTHIFELFICGWVYIVYGCFCSSGFPSIILMKIQCCLENIVRMIQLNSLRMPGITM